MKNILLKIISLSFLLALIINYTNATEDEDAGKVFYKWEAGKEYIYEYYEDNLPDGKPNGDIKTKFSIIKADGDNFEIAYSDTMPNKIDSLLFIRIDKYGKLLSSKISPDTRSLQDKSYDKSYLFQILTSMYYPEDKWRLPEHNNENGEKASVKEILNGENQLEICSPPSIKFQVIKTFDFTKGLLSEISTTQDKTISWVAKLSGVNVMSNEKINELKERQRNAIPIDEYSYKLLKHCLSCTDYKTRFCAVSQFIDKLNGSNIKELYLNDLKQTPMREGLDDETISYLDSYFVDAVLAGKDWAFELLNDKKFTPDRRISEQISDSTGLDVSKDPNAINEWREKIKKVLPEYVRSQDEEYLMPALKSPDDVVKYTALSKLQGYSKISLLPYYVDLCSSKNEKIREYAQDQLRDFSGVDFKDDKDKWTDWIERIKKVLPKLDKSSDEELEKNKNNEDPMVQAFIKECIQGSETLRQIESNSIHDVNTK